MHLITAKTWRRCAQALCAAGIVLSCLSPDRAVAAPARPGAADQTGPTLLTNGDFDSGMAPWVFEKQAGVTGASGDVINGLDLPPGVPGRPVRFEVNTPCKANWHVQFYQGSVQLEDGEPYTLTFWARSDRNRPLTVQGVLDHEDFHRVGLEADNLPLTPDWRRYTIDFVPEATVPGHTRVTFLLADAVGSVDLAAIRLRRGAAEVAPTNNILRDPSLAHGQEYWALQTEKGAAQATLDVLSGQSGPGRTFPTVADINVAQIGQHDWSIELCQDELNLVDGEAYRVSFWVRSDVSRPLNVEASLDMADWHSVGLEAIHLPITNAWRHYSLTFYATHAVHDHCRLAFQVGSATGHVQLADLALGQAEPAEPAPITRRNLVGVWESTEGPSGRRVRLTMNGDGTGSLMDISAGHDEIGLPDAPNPHAFRWYVTDHSRTLVIGDARYSWSVETTGAGESLVLRDSHGKSHALMRR